MLVSLSRVSVGFARPMAGFGGVVDVRFTLELLEGSPGGGLHLERLGSGECAVLCWGEDVGSVVKQAKGG